MYLKNKTLKLLQVHKYILLFFGCRKYDKCSSRQERKSFISNISNMFVCFQILEEDRTRFLDRVGDAGGGQYVVNAKHILTELAAASIGESNL